MAALTEEQIKIIRAPNLAHVATLMKDGTPQSTPVWVDYDGKHVIINTAAGRQKPRNLARDPRIALSVVDRERLGHYVEIRGRVVEMTVEGAGEHYESMRQKYLGQAVRSGPDPGEVRLIVRIEPQHVSGMMLG